MTKFGNWKHKRSARHLKRRQSGVALILALIVLSILSILAIGVMSTTQSEIWSTANYRNAIQARYVAEAGAQEAARYISQTPLVATSLAAALGSLNTATVPVTYNGLPVFIQSSTSNPVPTVTNSTQLAPSVITTSTFPSSGLISDFQATVGGTASTSPFTFGSTSGSTSTGYSVAIQLLAVQPATTGFQTKWKIVSVGTVVGVKTAKVQVVETVEGTLAQSLPTNPLFNYGLYATGTGCDVVTMTGGQDSESFDSSTGTTTNTHKGDIAANGSINLVSYTIDGSVFSPLSAGISSTVAPYNIMPSGKLGPYIGGGATAENDGTCDKNNPAMHFAVYEDNSGAAVVTNGAGNPRTNGSLGSCYQQQNCPTGYNTFNYLSPLPTVNDPVMPVITGTLTCPLCANSAGVTLNATTTSAIATSTYGNITIGGSTPVTLVAPGVYNFDSLNITGSGKILLQTPANCAGGACKVTINIVASQASGTAALNINGAGIANSTGDPANLLINYNGAGNVSLTGSGTMWGTIDAPHAAFSNTGGAKMYGGVIAKTALMQGSGQIIYDTHLKSVSGGGGIILYTKNPLFISEFSWSTY